MDKTDVKILTQLIKNSRTPITLIAKKLRVSREVITYRINRLEKQKIIQCFITEINIAKLGFVSAAIFVNVKATQQNAFKKYLKQSNFVSWVAELSGVWSFGFTIVGKTNQELDQRFQDLQKQFKDSIIDHRFTLHKQSQFFYEKYFGHKIISGKINTKIQHIDKTDRLILRKLSVNSRIDCVTLSKSVKLTAPAIATRIKNLQASGIIERFSIFIDTQKVNLYQYSIFVINKDSEQRDKIIQHLKEHPKISFIAEYVSDPFIEFGIVVSNPYKLKETLQEIEEAFPQNRVIEISLFQEEFISIGPPPCVFE